MRPADERYFSRLEEQLEEALDRAQAARKQGRDPEPAVEIPVARDMADRVENILDINGVAGRVRELEEEMSREEAALALVEDFVAGSVGSFDDRAATVEGAVRTAVALLTEGVVAAPIEGIDRVELLENDDGSEFINVYYAGPIRSAGGTAQALSVLAADYARSLLGIEEFHARETETERYAEEVALYDTETGLQYTPKAKEVKYIVSNLPIMVDGEATGGEEVSGFRDLERVDTNSARGGMCLVLAEGIALKAPKIQRYTRSLDEVDWPWLQDLIDGTIGGDDRESETAAAAESAAGESGDSPGDTTTEPGVADGSPRPEASSKFLRDLIAGRPVFSHPSESGGFRLRYGRARNHGFATAGVHPATMHLVDDFLATGTQIKTERPGKAAGVVPVDSIEGPTVKLANGDVRRIDDSEEAKQVRNGVKEVLDLGEYLVNYGEFVENNHPLAPASYTTEWWIAEFETTDANVRALQDDPRVNLADPSIDNALRWAQEFDCPLHPSYTYLWHDVTVETLLALADAIESGEITDGELTIERTEATRVGAESLLLDHTQTSDSLEIPEWQPLVESLGFNRDLQREWAASDLSAEAKEFAGGENAIRAVNEVAPFTLRERAPTRIGNRMGRPEKSESRDLSPAVHTLFPINEAGGAQRDLADASRQMDDQGRRGMLNVEVSERECPDCGELTFHNRCPDCGTHTEPHYECDDCGTICEPDDSGRIECPRCEWEVSAATDQEVDVNAAYRDALEAVGERESGFEILKGVQGLVSTNKPPEPIEKGILRAKNDVTAFKDGTVRYDMTDLPVTAVRPAELGVSADQFLELGYQEDIDGDQLRHDDQLVELNVQDIVLSDGAAEHMLKTADFVDDLLEQYYDLPRFYDVTDRDDLVGELVFGMAPHTSAATVGRVVGFTSAAVGYAHPYFHAAKRRNCFHPETEIEYRDDTGWHRETIDEFVEDRLQNPEPDDFGALVEKLDGNIDVPSIDEHGTRSAQPVAAVSKHPSQDHLVAVETGSGRSIRVTPDHTMLRVADGGVHKVAASELEIGDSVPAATPRGKTSANGVAGATADGGVEAEQVVSVDIRRSDVDHTYNLTVAETHTLAANDLLVAQCDGDEDCVMLLMDGLLNFSQEYLPDQRGGSVAENSRLVARDPQGRMRYLSFDEFWDELESPIDVDGKFKKRTCVREGWQTYTFDEDHESSLQPIERAIRYRADDDETLLNVETQFGRSLDITPNHSLFRYDDGIEEVAGEELGIGDLIIAPQQLDVEPQAQTETVIDVAECVEDPHEFTDETGASCLQEEQNESGSGSEAGAVVDGGLSGNLSQTQIQHQTPRDIEGVSQHSLAERNPQVSRKGSSDGVRRYVSVTGDFSWLLGLLAAQGSMSSAQPTITTADETIVRRAERSITEALGVEPSVRWANGTCEIGLPAVFQDILVELGCRGDPSPDSSETVVPEPIRRGDRSTVRSFLRGLIAGDGNRDRDLGRDGDGDEEDESGPIDGTHTSTAFHTTSENLKDGIVFLLHRLGVVATVSGHGRDRPSQQGYTVTVAGGATDDPLRRVLDGEDPHQQEQITVDIPEELLEIRQMDIADIAEIIPADLERGEHIDVETLESIVETLDERDLPTAARESLETFRPIVDGDLTYLRVTGITPVEYDGYLYDLQVGGEPVFTANWLYAHNSMDAPLVMSSRIDPSEIDDEAHNMDIVREYPLEFYEATREMADPSSVADLVQIGEDTLGTDDEYRGFDHTHDVTDIAMGPDLSAYKTLGSMMDKMDAQLELGRKLRAVDETDVAERVIEYHFLPDLIGNLRAFARQDTRCLDCGKKYRRAPLTGECRECGGNVTLTVHRGSVNKYLDTAVEVADRFDCRPYTKQRLEVLEKSLESIFQDDTNKQSGIADFM